MDVAVVGAGVVGLAAAVRLAEAGHAVRVVARELPARTTSAVAAALWYPYRALPREAVTRWSAASYRVLTALAEQPEAGVDVRWGTVLLRAAPTEVPWWRSAVEVLEPVDADPSGRSDPAAALPPGFGGGWRLPVPVVDMGVHLPWLVGRLAALGVEPEVRALTDLDGIDADVVVDCAGLGARELVRDPSLTPVRGQVVIVEQVGLTEWVLVEAEDEELTYVVPRRRHVVLGGTAQEGDEDAEPDPATAAAILGRCRALVPALAEARVVAHRVGFRPARPVVRLETEHRAGRPPVIHCYGHGGAGVTLSWGCADDVVTEVAALPLTP